MKSKFGSGSIWFSFDDADLERALKQFEGVPQKCVTPAARKGATVVRRAARASAPVFRGKPSKQTGLPVPGLLRTSITLKGEKSRLKGKKVYEVTFNASMNDQLQHSIKNQGKYGGKSEKAYYPASMEYGWLYRKPDGSIGKHEGYHFMKAAAEASGPAAEAKIIAELTKALNKEWSKRES